MYVCFQNESINASINLKKERLALHMTIIFLGEKNHHFFFSDSFFYEGLLHGKEHKLVGTTL